MAQTASAKAHSLHIENRSRLTASGVTRVDFFSETLITVQTADGRLHIKGVLLGFAYAVLEFLRLLFSLGKIAAAVTDVLFCLFAAVVTFLLSLAVSVGHARFFQIACEVIGFLCVQVTVTHGICRFLPYAERRLHGFRNRIFAKCAQGRRKKVEALLKSGKKHKSFLNKSKKSKKRT